MEYTTLGKTGLRVSRLGFGCMRLPMKTGTEVDRELALPMLHRGLELGINYFDTAVGYCAGDSQRVLGEAMEDRRDKVILSTKNHHYDKTDKDMWWKNLNDSLERLRTDHIDIYNFHGMNFERFQDAVDGEDGLYQEVLKAKEQGMVRHICHSFHGSPESLHKCIDTGLFEVVTLQYNLLDQTLDDEIAYAHENGMGVVVMGPVGGGRLGYPSGKAQEIAGEVKSTPELALRFVLSNQAVSIALSGMSTMEQLEDNVKTVSNLGELAPEDHKRIEDAVQERKKLAGLYCTGCNYCMPCPDSVDIPANFEILNLDRVFGLTEHARSRYAALGGKAALCRQCGKCVELCPQELDIPTRLGEAVALLDERSGSVAGWSELRKARMTDDGLVAVDLRYQLKSFTEEEFSSVSVSLHPHREEHLDPESFDVDRLKGFARRHRDLTLTTTPPLESISIDSLVTFNGSHTLEHFYHIAATARGIDGSPSMETRPVGSLVHVPGATHPAHLDSTPPKGHSYDFVCAYDEQHLYVWVEVEDDLAGAVKDKPAPRLRNDMIRVYLDGRSNTDIGLGGPADGVINISICPREPGNNDPFVQVSKDVPVNATLEHTQTGYRTLVAVPWTSFVLDKKRPDVIGFDIAQSSYDAEGAAQVRLSWTGRERQERDTSRLGKLLMM